MSKKILFLIIIIILFIAGASYYWLVYRGEPIPLTVTEENPEGFNPFNRNTVTPPVNTAQNPVATTTVPIKIEGSEEIPRLRLISSTPVGGMSASTTASSTVLRYVDRGTGYIYEEKSNEENIIKLSNTTLPRIYESYWNKNLNAFVLRYIKSNTDVIINFYGEMRTTKSTTTDQTNTTPYEIRGKFLSGDIREIVVSPKKDKIFTLNIEDGKGVGYISGFDESKKIKVVDTPITQMSVFWPEENSIFLNTKASGLSSGYTYLLNPQNSSVQKILGKVSGLTINPSSDAKNILFGTSVNGSLITSVYSITNKTSQNVIFKTLPEKCIWSTIHKNESYCAVPTEIPIALYPDDWYKGKVSFIDQIWHLDIITGEVKLVANLLSLSNKLIDATNLTLDPKENYLYFINKRDLSLWSLDLNR